MPTEEKIRECPFCGEANMVAHGLFADQEMMVRCLRCHANGPIVQNVPEIGDIGPFIDAAYKRWNTRAGQASVSGREE